MYIVCPLTFECSKLAKLCSAWGWQLHSSGPGAAGIRKWASQNPIESGRTVILAGVAGGLSTATEPGEVLQARKVVDTRGGHWQPSVIFEHTASGTCLSVDAPLERPQQKAEALEKFAADFVDMESGAFAEVACERRWKWGVLRGISDGALDALPPGISQWTTDDGRTRFGQVLRAILTQPTSLKTLARLARNSNRAMRQVERTLHNYAERETAPRK